MLVYSQSETGIIYNMENTQMQESQTTKYDVHVT